MKIITAGYRALARARILKHDKRWPDDDPLIANKGYGDTFWLTRDLLRVFYCVFWFASISSRKGFL